MIETEWALYRFMDSTHLIPMDDIDDHELHIECKCSPEIGEGRQEGLIIHHSFDGREPFETGERKVS